MALPTPKQPSAADAQSVLPHRNIAEKEGRWDDSVARLVPSRWYPILLPGSVRTAFYLSNLRP